MCNARTECLAFKFHIEQKYCQLHKQSEPTADGVAWYKFCSRVGALAPPKGCPEGYELQDDFREGCDEFGPDCHRWTNKIEECAVMCNARTECLAFKFHTTNKDCQLHKQSETTADGVPWYKFCSREGALASPKVELLGAANSTGRQPEPAQPREEAESTSTRSPSSLLPGVPFRSLTAHDTNITVQEEASRPRRLDDRECWGGCGTKGGFCPSWCGPLQACCRWGWPDPPECKGTASHNRYHSCVVAVRGDIFDGISSIEME